MALRLNSFWHTSLESHWSGVTVVLESHWSGFTLALESRWAPSPRDLELTGSPLLSAWHRLGFPWSIQIPSWRMVWVLLAVSGSMGLEELHPPCHSYCSDYGELWHLVFLCRHMLNEHFYWKTFFWNLIFIAGRNNPCLSRVFGHTWRLWRTDASSCCCVMTDLEFLFRYPVGCTAGGRLCPLWLES